MLKEILPNIFLGGRKLYTRNLTPGRRAHREALVTHNDVEFREWRPQHSKLGAAILKGSPLPPITEGSRVLYLGASTGNTVSFVSDILGPEGLVYAVEFAPRVMRQLVYLAQDRPNIVPILADAGKPESYAHQALAPDLLFMDIAQRDQVAIFEKNAHLFLPKGGYALLALKARSIDVTSPPRAIYQKARAQLMRSFAVIDGRELFPFEKDHMFFVCQKK